MQDIGRGVTCGNPVVHLPGGFCRPARLVLGEGGFAHGRVIPQEAVAQAG